jgi:hypothetical protein
VSKRTLWQATLAVLFAGATAMNVTTLVHHDVPAAALGFAAIAMTSLGVTVVRLAGPATAVQTFSCIDRGCDFEIRSASQDPAKNARLRALAADHAKHGPATT